MLIPGAAYKAKKSIAIDFPQKDITESLERGEITFFFSQSILVPTGQMITVLESKKTTLKRFSKILYNEKIYHYWYSDKDPNNDWELIC